MEKKCDKLSGCNVISLLNTFWKRWSLAVLFNISEWKNRFNDIKRSSPWISSKILSSRLKELELFWYIEKNIDISNNINYIITKKTDKIKILFLELNKVIS